MFELLLCFLVHRAKSRATPHATIGFLFAKYFSAAQKGDVTMFRRLFRPKPLTKAQGRKTLVWSALFGLSTGVASLWVLKTGEPDLLFSGIARMMVVLQKPFTKVNMEFDHVSGSFDKGTLDFRNLRVRSDKGVAQMDVTFDRLAVDFGVGTSGLMRGNPFLVRDALASSDPTEAVVVERVLAKGVKGFMTVLKRTPEKPLPNILLGDVFLANVNVMVGDGHGRTEPLIFPPIRIDSLHMARYHLRKPVNVLLFNTTASGQVGSAPFEIQPKQLVSAGVPVEFISKFLRPPLSWVRTGDARVRVDMSPSEKVPGQWLVKVELSLKGPAEAIAIYGDAANSQIANYLNDRDVSVRAEVVVAEDPGNETRFVEELNQEFAKELAVRAAAPVVEAAVAAAGAIKSWWPW